MGIPQGGFSLIIHIAIVLIGLLKRYMILVFGKSKKKISKEKFKKIYFLSNDSAIVREESDSVFRRTFAYGIITLLLFFTATSTIVSVINRLEDGSNIMFAYAVIDIVKEQFTEDSVPAEIMPDVIEVLTQSTINSDFEIPTTPAPVETPIGETYQTNSLVDFLYHYRIDTTFENRVRIAQEFNVEQYAGTEEENAILLSKLKSLVPSRLASYSQSGTN